MSKKKTLVLWIGLLCLVGLVLIVFEIKHKGQTTQVGSVLETQAAPQSIEGFNRASGPIPLNFPADHGPHPDYQTEWWYFTGNLEAADGRHFGYQLTFFRRALAPPNETTPRPSEWATNQAYLAHFALTDVSDERYQAFERLERGAASLAGAQAEPFQVWLDDWKVMETQPGLYQIEAAEGVIQLKLNLTDRKGPILQGDQGYSQKGPDPGNASYYVSLPS